MNLTVVAEDVETSNELDLVRLVGCDRAQGRFYGAPRTQEVVELLARERSARP